MKLIIMTAVVLFSGALMLSSCSELKCKYDEENYGITSTVCYDSTGVSTITTGGNTVTNPSSGIKLLESRLAVRFFCTEQDGDIYKGTCP